MKDKDTIENSMGYLNLNIGNDAVLHPDLFDTSKRVNVNITDY